MGCVQGKQDKKVICKKIIKTNTKSPDLTEKNLTDREHSIVIEKLEKPEKRMSNPKISTEKPEKRMSNPKISTEKPEKPEKTEKRMSNPKILNNGCQTPNNNLKQEQLNELNLKQEQLNELNLKQEQLNEFKSENNKESIVNTNITPETEENLIFTTKMDKIKFKLQSLKSKIKDIGCYNDINW